MNSPRGDRAGRLRELTFELGLGEERNRVGRHRRNKKQQSLKRWTITAGVRSGQWQKSGVLGARGDLEEAGELSCP